MPEYRNVILATPLLSQSQIKFRLGLVRQCSRTYPLDSMDFIMMDLTVPILSNSICLLHLPVLKPFFHGREKLLFL